MLLTEEELFWPNNDPSFPFPRYIDPKSESAGPAQHFIHDTEHDCDLLDKQTYSISDCLMHL